MTKAKILSDMPVLKATIHTNTPSIKGYLYSDAPVIKGIINTTMPFIVGRIKKAIDHEPEPYYEVANQYGTTIIIGD